MPAQPHRTLSSLLPPSTILDPNSQSFRSNGISQSTASLPPKYTITLGLPLNTELSEEQRCQKYKEGEEYLADAWRRPGDSSKEGKVEDRRRKRIVRLAEDDSGGDEGVKLEKGGVLWYTAGSRMPCSCNLPIYHHAYTFPPPPLSHDLPALPPYPNPDLIPEIGPALGDWINKSQDTYTDFAPWMDELEEFEIGWQTATGSSWLVKPAPQVLPTLLGIRGAPAVDSGSTIIETDDARRLRKGKGKALNEYLHSKLPPHRLSIIPETPHQIPSSRAPNPVSAETEDNWIMQSKKRKIWWQAQILHAPYGDLFTIIPQPHDLHSFIPSRSKHPAKPPRPPDYILPRYFSNPANPHPYHPNLHSHILSNPKSRVHWLIPIHGPILLPPSPHPKLPLPSSASLSSFIPPQTKPPTLNWTPGILLHFWTKFLIPLHTSRQFRNLSIRLSGPKPDVFLDLPVQGKLEEGVRMEVGDHIRIYCDLGVALSLRTWLNGVEVDLGAVCKGTEERGEEGEGKKGEGMFRLFEKVRLVLVGGKGEALIVA